MPLPLPPSLPARPNVSIRGGSVQPPSPPVASATPSASQPPAPPGLPAPPAGRKVMAYDDLAGGVEEGEVKSDDEEWEREVRERREGMRMREERRREREEEDRRRRSDRWAPERDRGRSYRGPSFLFFGVTLLFHSCFRWRLHHHLSREFTHFYDADTRLSPRRSPRPSYWRPSRSRSRSPRRRRSFSLSRSRSPRGHSRSPRGRSRSRTRSLSPRSRRSYGSRSRSRTVSRSLSRSPSSRRSSRSRSRGRDRSRSRSRERSRSPARSTPLPSIPTGPKQMIPSGPKRQYSHHPGGPSQGPPKRIMASRPIGVPPPNAPTGPKEFQQGQTSQSQSQPQIQSPAGRSLAKGIVVKRTLSSSGGTGEKAEEGEVAAKGTNVETPIPTGPRSLIDKVSTPPGSGSSTRNPPTPLPPGAIPAGPRAMGLPPKIIPTVNSVCLPSDQVYQG
ncbi:hypothetical protein BT69DRAFT_500049 [Atractiella rhizophila]|nr:hypothetical protein BT69DRAFT_500049 [Atractiella rhizophila]